jgi:hypothetical protein
MQRVIGRLAVVAIGVLRWLAQRPAYMMLTAGDEELARQPPRRFAHAWVGMMLLSLVWGLATVQVWSLTWGVFGDYSGIPLMPAAAVLSVYALWLYRHSILALAGVILTRQGHQVLATGTILVALSLILLGLKSLNPDYPTDLPPAWQWIRPRTMYRALSLAPLWGGWAMLVACQFSKPAESAPPAVAAFAAGCTPLAACVVLAAVLSATIVYFGYLPWRPLSISAVAMVVAAAAGPAVSKRRGGLDRNALLATNLLTQLAFLLACLANRNPY